jgi:hypothetical protein
MSSLATDDEIFELVDANNVLTGETEKRKIVHQKGLLHRSVHRFCIVIHLEICPRLSVPS